MQRYRLHRFPKPRDPSVIDLRSLRIYNTQRELDLGKTYPRNVAAADFKELAFPALQSYRLAMQTKPNAPDACAPMQHRRSCARM